MCADYVCMVLASSPSNEWLIFKLTGDTAAHFTQGRSLTLLSVLRSGYKPAGIGTSYNVVHRIIEMDLIQFYLETTIIGLIIIVFAYIFPQETYCML